MSTTPTFSTSLRAALRRAFPALTRGQLEAVVAATPEPIRESSPILFISGPPGWGKVVHAALYRGVSVTTYCWAWRISMVLTNEMDLMDDLLAGAHDTEGLQALAINAWDVMSTPGPAREAKRSTNNDKDDARLLAAARPGMKYTEALRKVRLGVVDAARKVCRAKGVEPSDENLKVLLTQDEPFFISDPMAEFPTSFDANPNWTMIDLSSHGAAAVDPMNGE